MNENAEKGRISELVENERTIRALQSELEKFRDIAAKWKINFSTELISDPAFGGYAVRMQAKTGEKGMVYTLPASEIEYFTNDRSSIANDLASQFLINVLLEQAQKEMVPEILKAFDNAVRMQKSSL